MLFAESLTSIISYTIELHQESQFDVITTTCYPMNTFQAGWQMMTLVSSAGSSSLGFLARFLEFSFLGLHSVARIREFRLVPLDFSAGLLGLDSWLWSPEIGVLGLHCWILTLCLNFPPEVIEAMIGRWVPHVQLQWSGRRRPRNPFLFTSSS